MQTNNNTGKIYSVEKLLEGVPNLGIFQGDFKSHNQNIYPTDLDGLIEIKGQFLVHEYKKNGTKITKGQEILQKQLLDKGICILNLWHIGPCFKMNIVKMQVLVPKIYAFGKYKYTNLIVDNDGKNILQRVHSFHAWWTNRAISIAKKRYK